MFLTGFQHRVPDGSVETAQDDVCEGASARYSHHAGETKEK